MPHQCHVHTTPVSSSRHTSAFFTQYQYLLDATPVSCSHHTSIFVTPHQRFFHAIPVSSWCHTSVMFPPHQHLRHTTPVPFSHHTSIFFTPHQCLVQTTPVSSSRNISGLFFIIITPLWLLLRETLLALFIYSFIFARSQYLLHEAPVDLSNSSRLTGICFLRETLGLILLQPTSIFCTKHQLPTSSRLICIFFMKH